MDRGKLFRHLDQRYASKREMISRIPLGVQPDALWQELLNQRRSKSTVLPLYNCKGNPFWYVTTDKMVAASEKIVEALFENETDFDPYVDPFPVSSLEEVFYTSYVEGAQISMQDAMSFLTSDQAPRDIEEQMISNNRFASSYAGANLFRPIDAEYLHDLIFYLTDGMDVNPAFRSDEEVDCSISAGESFSFPLACTIPDRVGEYSSFLQSPQVHPLIKAAVAQAYMLILRPFPEGNERLGRILSNIILLRAGYTFFSEVSLSALIARKSFGYYEAIVNILREENGCDLTYFIEYFLELLSRAVDERRFRLNQKEEQNRKAEIEMAHTALMPSKDGDRFIAAPVDEASHALTANTDELDLSGYELVSITNFDNDEQSLGTLLSAEEVSEEAKEVVKAALFRYGAENKASRLGKAANGLVDYINNGKYVFTTADLERDFDLDHRAKCIMTQQLREANIIEQIGREGRYFAYGFCFPQGQSYDPALIDMLKELMGSDSSPKDRRVGSRLMEYLPKGEITSEDYAANDEASKWSEDMRFALQLGLVDRISAQQYRIRNELRAGPPQLSDSQKRIAKEMYDCFGDGFFSTEMVVATLDYSGPHISAILHRFTLLRILDCRKEDVYRYQFLINPQENPEFFINAA